MTETKKLKDVLPYLFGCIGGMFGVLLSHPLDTIKTHVQTGKLLSSFKPSIHNFYKGLSIPLLGVGFEKAIVFGAYNKVLNETNSIALSGAIAGLSASLIVSPYERLKILKQNSHTFTLKDIVKPSFLFKGLTTTFSREVPGFAIYFSVYEYLKKVNFTNHNKEITGVASFVYGGISGLSAWIFIYPQDKIKTIIQSNISYKSNTIINETTKTIIFKNSKTNIYNIINNIYNEKGIVNGLKYFYIGFTWAAGRAMLLHSGTFFMVETLNGKISLDTIY
jgi:solute carrier family 25 carnitine/acylcarnitine transporter 20/29